jgi:hypothetical protein
LRIDREVWISPEYGKWFWLKSCYDSIFINAMSQVLHMTY